MAAISQPSLPFDAALRSASLSGERDVAADPDARLKASRSEPDARLPAASPVEGEASRAPVMPYVFVRHPRARRYLLRVTDEGTVRVTVPRWGSKREAEAFAAREHAWIEKQLREREQRTTNGGISASNHEPCEVDRPALVVRAKHELPRRLLELAARHGLAVARVSIRNQRWRWGSCSRSGHICLNWRLVTMPDLVRDYVLIHELMHLKRMDHSPTFWKLVADAFPPYQEARTWLRRHTLRS